MKIGILSDSHDNLPMIERAVNAFADHKVALVLHAGDFVSPFTAIPLANLTVPLIGVLGNNDGDPLYLTRRFHEFGTIYPGYHVFEVDGKKAVLMHQPKSIDALVASRHYDLIVYGHTHDPDLRDGTPAVVNPGESSGWLTGRATVAVFDTERMRAELVVL